MGLLDALPCNEHLVVSFMGLNCYAQSGALLVDEVLLPSPQILWIP